MSDAESPGRNQYRLRWTPLTPGAPRPYNTGRAVMDKAMFLQVPAFTAGVLAWTGASYQVARTVINAGMPWAISKPIARPSGLNACAAVRFTSGGTVYRWKLWQDVGEVLHWSLYDGTVLPEAGVYLEFWSIDDDQLTMTLATAWNIKLTALTFPEPFYDYSDAIFATAPAICKTSDSSPTTIAEFCSVCT